jgi:hypothetical protein
MTLPGQDDERPGDEPEGIYYFDFSDPFGPSEDEPDADPFASEAPGAPDATDQARPARSKQPPHRRDEEGEASRDAFELALTNLFGSTPAPSAEPSGEEQPADTEEPSELPDVTFSPLTSLVGSRDHSADPRDEFAAAFDEAQAADEPFLAVALRMDAEAPTSAQFPAVEQGVRTALDPGDALLAAPEHRCLVAVLPGRDAEAARPLFTRLMDHLREHVPNAEDVGHSISVLSAPNGRPFRRGIDFLAATFDAS